MTDKPKKKNEPLPLFQKRVPLWLALFMSVVILVSMLILLNDYSSPDPIQPIIITTTPSFYGAPQTDFTFIEALGSPTPSVDELKLERMKEPRFTASTPMCRDLIRTENGQFVFRIFLQIGMELYRIDEDGTQLCRLTDNDGNDDYPTWSPDGTQIAYVSNDTEYGLYLMDANGENIELLHTGGSAYSHPAWSPDGRYLVFQATFDEVFDIYRLELATGEISNLTNQERLDNMPAYSPDGQFIVFTSDRTFNPFIHTNPASQFSSYEIYMMDSDGRNPRRLTVNNRGDTHPTFSLDGTQIAFGNWEIFIMNRDGSGVRRLTNGREPLWLPDGRIAYIGNEGIYTIASDGSDEQVLINKIPWFGSGISQFDYIPPK